MATHFGLSLPQSVPGLSNDESLNFFPETDLLFVAVFRGSFYRAGKACWLFVDLSLASVAKNSRRPSVKLYSRLQSGRLDLANPPFLPPDAK